MAVSLAQLIETKRIIVCVGAGGVGKTTISAALGVLAARSGRRALVLTVDPAKRLANALGLEAFSENIQRIEPDAFAAQGCAVAVPLDAAMLDVKRTFDRVVSRYSKTAQSRDKILNHPFYQQASTALAGSQEYMAMERLYECASTGDYDLIVLDTPPSAHALDFLDAPNRLVDLFDSTAFRLLLKPTQKLRSNPFRGGSIVMRGLSKFTSVEMFGNLLEFFGHLSETFDGFVQRARDVQRLLHSPDTTFVLVSACDATSGEQAAYLRDQLTEQKLQVGALVLNRVAPFPPKLSDAGSELDAGFAELLQHIGGELASGDVGKTARQLAMAARQLSNLARADARHLAQVRAGLPRDAALVAVPRANDEPDTLSRLFRLAELLQAGGMAQPN